MNDGLSISLSVVMAFAKIGLFSICAVLAACGERKEPSKALPAKTQSEKPVDESIGAREIPAKEVESDFSTEEPDGGTGVETADSQPESALEAHFGRQCTGKGDRCGQNQAYRAAALAYLKNIKCARPVLEKSDELFVFKCANSEDMTGLINPVAIGAFFEAGQEDVLLEINDGSRSHAEGFSALYRFKWNGESFDKGIDLGFGADDFSVLATFRLENGRDTAYICESRTHHGSTTGECRGYDFKLKKSLTSPLAYYGNRAECMTPEFSYCYIDNFKKLGPKVEATGSVRLRVNCGEGVWKDPESCDEPLSEQTRIFRVTLLFDGKRLRYARPLPKALLEAPY